MRRAGGEIRYNTRPQVGGHGSRQLPCRGEMFQVTPPCRGRPLSEALHNDLHGFKSRPHVGGDIIFLQRAFEYDSFKSRPHVGGDFILFKSVDTPSSFKSRPHVGGDQGIAVVCMTLTMFQVTPPCRGRLKVPALFFSFFRFKSRPHVGGDIVSSTRRFSQSVSSHAPM